MKHWKTALGLSLGLGMAVVAGAASATAQDDGPAATRSALTPAQLARAIVGEKIEFASRDEGQTKLVGYLYRPANAAEGRAPAVVLMHGRAGAYSNQAKGVYDATTLTQRHRYWANYWAARGYYVLVVDSFGGRGFPEGFAAGTYSTRPASINEVTIRPLDAYGALRYLRTLPEVDRDRIGVMGFSNGASAVLATMADDKPGDMTRLGFRAGLAFYPGCGLQNRFRRQGYKTYAPVAVHMGTADEEVSYDTCRNLVTSSQAAGSAINLTTYQGASHSFDDPGTRRQSVPANAEATRQVREEAARFFEEHLAPR